jgi:hypothetical protein
MRRSDLVKSLRMLKFGQIRDRWDNGTLSQFEAAELLRMLVADPARITSIGTRPWASVSLWAGW